MSKPCMCLLSSLQTWQWAVRSEERSVEAEYWSLTVTGMYPRKAWCWARSWEQPGPTVAACLDLDSLCEEAKTWTTISILVNTHTEQVGPPLLFSPCCIKKFSPTCIPSLLHSPSSSFHYSLPPLHSWPPHFIVSPHALLHYHPCVLLYCFPPLLFSAKVISQRNGV